jgi:hypothetical protein
MDDLVTWLRAQIDEDERIARPLAERPWTWLPDEVMRDMSEHIVRHDPARVLREIEAKRRILDVVLPKVAELQGACDDEWGARLEPDGDDMLLRTLALPYADRAGYREEWRP